MIKLTTADVALLQRLALNEGASLTEAEAMVLATRLVLLYERLALPTPSEIEEKVRLGRAEYLAILLENMTVRRHIASLKRGRGRQL